MYGSSTLSVAQVEAFDPYTEAEVILYATLSSREDNDPIDNEIIARCKSFNIFERIITSYRWSSFKPFDPVAKRAEATVLDQESGNIFKVSKGAPQVILPLSYNKQEIASKVQVSVDVLANKGYRSLGVAKMRCTVPKDAEDITFPIITHL